MNQYIGHESQLCFVEGYRLTDGKADGMRMMRVRNAAGLDFEISLDRCGDISRLSVKGDNFGYIAPCGYVSPKYYDNKGNGFLKSFTAGFFTTCGLTSVGTPCTDEGEELPLHGTISNTPCENTSHWIKNDEIHIQFTVRDASLFSYQLLLEREYVCYVNKNVIHMTDSIKNIGSKESPLEILYHCNMGYPLLSERTKVSIPSTKVYPRNDHSARDIDNCMQMEKPQPGYEERCYYHTLSGETCVSITNPDIGKGLRIRYNANELRYFTEWKMMGQYEYVLGMEPGNCTPDGRNVMRQNGTLKILSPSETIVYHLTFEFTEE